MPSATNPELTTITERINHWQSALTKRIECARIKQQEQHLINLDIPCASSQRTGVCLVPSSNQYIKMPLDTGLEIKATSNNVLFNGQIAHTYTPWPGSIHACVTQLKQWRLILNWRPIDQPTPTAFTLYCLTDLARSLAVHLLQHTTCITCYPQQAPTLKSRLAWRPALYTTPALQTHHTHRGNILSRWQDVTQCPSAYSGIHISGLKPACWPEQTKQLIIDFELTHAYESMTPLDPASCTLNHIIVFNRQNWQSDPWHTQAHQYFYQLRPPPPPQKIKQLQHITGTDKTPGHWFLSDTSPTLNITCLNPPATTKTLSARFITAENHWHRLPMEPLVTWKIKKIHEIQARCIHFSAPPYQEHDINIYDTLHQSLWETWPQIKRWIQYLCPEHTISSLSDKINQQKKITTWRQINHAYRPVATITYIVDPAEHYDEKKTDWFYWGLLCLYTWQALDKQGIHYQLQIKQHEKICLILPRPHWTPVSTSSLPISYAPN